MTPALSKALAHADHFCALKVSKLRDVNNQAALAVLRDEVRRLQAERRWIPCSERLPQVGEEVLLADTDIPFVVNMAMLAKDGNFYLAYSQEPAEPHTHWMPLPEGPG